MREHYTKNGREDDKFIVRGWKIRRNKIKEDEGKNE